MSDVGGAVTVPAPPSAGTPPRRRQDAAGAAGEDRRGDILAAARAEFARPRVRRRRRCAASPGRPASTRGSCTTTSTARTPLFAAAFELPGPARSDADRGRCSRPGSDGIGERLVRLFLSGLGHPTRDGSASSRCSSAASASEAGARMLREFLTREVFARIAARLGSDDAELRAALAASQMMGLAVARYVVRMEPLASRGPRPRGGPRRPHDPALPHRSVAASRRRPDPPRAVLTLLIRACGRLARTASARSIFIT